MTLLTDVTKLQTEIERVVNELDTVSRSVASHEEQISGVRGITATLEQIAQEIKSLRKAAYWVAGIIITGAVTFAFSALTIVGH